MLEANQASCLPVFYARVLRYFLSSFFLLSSYLYWFLFVARGSPLKLFQRVPRILGPNKTETVMPAKGLFSTSTIEMPYNRYQSGCGCGCVDALPVKANVRVEKCRNGMPDHLTATSTTGLVCHTARMCGQVVFRGAGSHLSYCVQFLSAREEAFSHDFQAFQVNMWMWIAAMGAPVFGKYFFKKIQFKAVALTADRSTGSKNIKLS